MSDWLSSTWEANWRSFQYFNLYRLVLAGLFLLAIVFPNEWTSRFNLVLSPALLGLTAGYALAVAGGWVLAVYWQKYFNRQLSAQVFLDIATVNLLMYVAGGVASGLAVLLLVSLAAASLVGRGRLVLFYAALSTLAVLLTQIHGVLGQHFEHASIVQAGFISAGFFATAILARLLGQRAMINEDLARRRGVALDNQIRISQRVVERMQDGVLIVGRNACVLRFNPVAQAMLALPTYGLPIDLHRQQPPLAAAFDAWLARQGEETVQFCAPNGQELSARFERTQSSDGEVLIFLEAVGRIKERAQQLKLAALGRLTASIAHEIRNPLAAISHAGELLREEKREEMQARLLRILHDNVGRLDRIVSDVLELGRQSRAAPECIELEPFCRAFVEHHVAAEGLPEGVLVFETEVASKICFDRAHLHRVLWNLVSNALRHSTRRPGAVCIRQVLSADASRVELHVIDDGPGIPDRVREQVFEPFFTTHHQGTGLGLFIARELCVANGASLELQRGLSGAHFVIAGRNDTCQLPEVNDAPSPS